MPSNNDANTYEQAKRLRRNVITTVLIVIAIIAAVFAYKQYQNVKENEKLLKERHAQIEKVQRHNKEIEKKDVALQKKVGIYETAESSADFYDKFFNWSSWQQYADNMKRLRTLYPQIDEGKVVNISGNKRGASASPDSSYERQTYVGKEKGQIGELVTQTKSYDDGTESKAIWYIISNKKDNKFDITSMKAYRDAN
ncbi:hypothetical protein [Staphylococcus haemolyticus]|uniref:hypothetical protein n=1 Tax=Staphylococcus haemolyticus TaxID=1283 RepID=UPI0011A71E6B|nr:hypothetical protein [Staphylococcus haemolyticus]